jgi:hypothetical protein
MATSLFGANPEYPQKSQLMMHLLVHAIIKSQNQIEKRVLL